MKISFMDGRLPALLHTQKISSCSPVPVREMVLLLYKVFCGRGIHVGAESMGHSLCCALSSSAVYRAGISRQQLSKWLCDLCGCNPKRKSCVTWKVLAQSAAVITLLLLQHKACNQCNDLGTYYVKTWASHSPVAARTDIPGFWNAALTFAMTIASLQHCSSAGRVRF